MKNIATILTTLLFFACGNQEKKIETVTATSENSNLITISKQQFESEKMAFGELVEHQFYNTVKTTGIIDVPPENRASVSTFMGGYVTKIPLLIGDKVKKGQLVASLQNPEFVEIQQDYLEVSAQLSYLKNEFKRQKTLYNEQITSEKNYLKAESTYKSNLARFNGLRKKLQMMNLNPTNIEKGEISSTINLYAPINGFVTKVNVSNGTYISSTNEVLEIINTEHIHLELNVFEKDILKIKKDQKIQFKIPETSTEIFEAEVYLVGTFVNTDRTIKVHGHINHDENTNFITGMFVDATIIYSENKEISFPKSAVLKNENNAFVFILNDENNDAYIFEKIKITTLLEDENFIQIKNHQSLKDKKILTEGLSMF
jgi:cobalt-zinc-cadmium efflux system membrane fusion protein